MHHVERCSRRLAVLYLTGKTVVSFPLGEYVERNAHPFRNVCREMRLHAASFTFPSLGFEKND